MFENNAKSWLIFNRHFLSLSKDFVFVVPEDFFEVMTEEAKLNPNLTQSLPEFTKSAEDPPDYFPKIFKGYAVAIFEDSQSLPKNVEDGQKIFKHYQKDCKYSQKSSRDSF